MDRLYFGAILHPPEEHPAQECPFAFPFLGTKVRYIEYAKYPNAPETIVIVNISCIMI